MMILDFRRTRIKSNSILGEEVEVVEEYIYTSVFTWTTDWTGNAILMLLIRGTKQTLLLQEA